MRVRAGEPHLALLGRHDLGQPREHVVDARAGCASPRARDGRPRCATGSAPTSTPAAPEPARSARRDGRRRARRVRRPTALGAAGHVRSSRASSYRATVTVARDSPHPLAAVDVDRRAVDVAGLVASRDARSWPPGRRVDPGPWPPGIIPRMPLRGGRRRARPTSACRAGPGATAFVVMPSAACSRARNRPSVSRPPFDAAYAGPGQARSRRSGR